MVWTTKQLIKATLATTLLVGGINISGVDIASAATTGTITYGVNFREEPSTSGDKIRLLNKGETVTILDQVNSYWYKVLDKNQQIGYISTNAKYIELNDSSSLDYTSSTSASIIHSVSFRTGPSTSNSRIRYLQEGETVTILEQVNSYWYKVLDKNQQVGYVSTNAKYIELNDSSSLDYTSNASASIIHSVSFRTGPSTSNSRIRYLQAGETVTILDQVNSYWYKVQDQSGTIGYVSTSSKYIDTNDGNTIDSQYNDLSASELAQKVINAGMAYLGTPYEYGSNRSSTATFDCSDFVRRAFIDALGITLPTDSRKQGDYVKELGNTTTNWEQLEPGDLMFFMDYKGTSKSNYSGIDKSTQRISHVGIYLGDGKILHTYSEDSGGVRIDSIEGRHWEYRFIFGGSAID